jgi:hypothetical protein
MAKKPAFNPQWQCLDGLSKAFTWGKKASYWKGTKGWWAKREGTAAMGGPFKTPKQAREWAEEPFRAEFEEGQQFARQLAEERNAQVEAKARQTWGELPPEERVLRPGQIWQMKQEKFQDRQVLILDVRKDTVVVQARSGEIPWEECLRDTRSIPGVLRLYRYLGRKPGK